MFCSGCGQSCIPNAKYCHHCGKSLSVVQDETSLTTSTSENINVITAHLPSTSHVAQQFSTASCSRRNVSSFSSFRARKEAER